MEELIVSTSFRQEMNRICIKKRLPENIFAAFDAFSVQFTRDFQKQSKTKAREMQYYF